MINNKHNKTNFSINIILVIFTLSAFLNAQAQMDWLKTFGDDKAQSGYQTLKLNDSSIIMIGITQGVEINYEEVLIVKILVTGDTILTRRIGKSSSITTPAICSTSDDGFVVSYTANKANGNLYDIFISKFDSNANVVWEKSYGTIENEVVKSIKQTNDGFILLGEYQIHSQKSKDKELLLYKVDVNGDYLWIRNIVQVGSGKSIAVSLDNSYAILGSFGKKVTKVDKNGDELWQKDFNFNIKGNYIESTNDGAYIITGVFDSKLMLLKMDSDGSVEWKWQFGDEARSIGFCVNQVSNEDFIATGQTTDNNGNTAIYIIKTDVNGILDWTYTKRTEMPEGTGLGKTVETPIPVDDKYNIEEISPGQYIIIGTVTDGGDWDIGLLKLTDLTTKFESERKTTDSKFKLLHNYPNPFNISTYITYEILKASYVKILIYNSMGNQIKKLIDEYQVEGKYNLRWNGTDDIEKSVSGGLYFYKIYVDGIAKTRKMILLK